MLRKTVIILRGLPASGKSTYAREMVANAEPGTVARINNDDLVEAMFPGIPPQTGGLGRLLGRSRTSLLRNLLSEPRVRTIIVDNTNLTAAAVHDVTRIAREHKAHVVINDSFLSVPVEECIARDALRPRPVGRAVIEHMAEHAAQLTKRPNLA